MMVITRSIRWLVAVLVIAMLVPVFGLAGAQGEAGTPSESTFVIQVPPECAASFDFYACIQTLITLFEGGDASGCTVTARVNANVRSGPGLNFGVVGTLAAGRSASADAQYIPGALRWWRIAYRGGTGWVREDVAPGNCGQVAVVDQQEIDQQMEQALQAQQTQTAALTPQSGDWLLTVGRPTLTAGCAALGVTADMVPSGQYPMTLTASGNTVTVSIPAVGTITGTRIAPGVYVGQFAVMGIPSRVEVRFSSPTQMTGTMIQSSGFCTVTTPLFGQKV